MCVIIVKRPGVAMPSEETLRACWQANPNGFGLMTLTDRHVLIRKGFMTVEHALKACRGIPDEALVVLHFRLATHGGETPGLCHPFPIRKHRLRWTNTKTSLAVAHNGIIDGFGDFKQSDTEEFVQDVLAGLPGLEDYDEKTMTLVECATKGSSLAFLRHDGALFLTGNWTESDGLMFSNMHWKAPEASFRFTALDPSSVETIMEAKECLECGDVAVYDDEDRCPECGQILFEAGVLDGIDRDFGNS